jgi:carbon-monoxide dehydrogenase large subunit
MSFLTLQVAPQGIGKPVRRREDARLLTGGGRFADETNLLGQGYACMVRSPHAHALIARIDTGPAEGMPGVLAVLTGSDAERDGLRPIPHRPAPANPHEVPLKSGGGSPFVLAPHPVLAFGTVRHVGEAVAVVVAERRRRRRLARNTVIESTFEVGRRFRCTMRVDWGQLDPGAVIRPDPGE